MNEANNTVPNCSNITFMPSLLNLELSKHKMHSSTTKIITIYSGICDGTVADAIVEPNCDIQTPADNQNHVDICNLVKVELLETNSNNQNGDDADVNSESIKCMKQDPIERDQRKYSRHTKIRNKKYIQLLKDKVALKYHLIGSDSGQTNDKCYTVRRKETLAMLRLKRILQMVTTKQNKNEMVTTKQNKNEAKKYMVFLRTNHNTIKFGITKQNKNKLITMKQNKNIGEDTYGNNKNILKKDKVRDNETKQELAGKNEIKQERNEDKKQNKGYETKQVQNYETKPKQEYENKQQRRTDNASKNRESDTSSETTLSASQFEKSLSEKHEVARKVVDRKVVDREQLTDRRQHSDKNKRDEPEQIGETSSKEDNELNEMNKGKMGNDKRNEGNKQKDQFSKVNKGKYNAPIADQGRSIDDRKDGKEMQKRPYKKAANTSTSKTLIPSQFDGIFSLTWSRALDLMGISGQLDALKRANERKLRFPHGASMVTAPDAAPMYVHLKAKEAGQGIGDGDVKSDLNNLVSLGLTVVSDNVDWSVTDMSIDGVSNSADWSVTDLSIDGGGDLSTNIKHDGEHLRPKQEIQTQNKIKPPQLVGDKRKCDCADVNRVEKNIKSLKQHPICGEGCERSRPCSQSGSQVPENSLGYQDQMSKCMPEELEFLESEFAAETTFDGGALHDMAQPFGGNNSSRRSSSQFQDLGLEMVKSAIRNLKTSAILENARIISRTTNLTQPHTGVLRRPSQSVRCSRRYRHRPQNNPRFKQKRIRKLIRNELLSTLQSSIETSHGSKNTKNIERSHISSPARSTAIDKIQETKHHKIKDSSPDHGIDRGFLYVNERSPSKKIYQNDPGIISNNTTKTELRFHSQSTPCVEPSSLQHHKSNETYKAIEKNVQAQQNEDFQNGYLDCKDCNHSKVLDFEIERRESPQKSSKDTGTDQSVSSQSRKKTKIKEMIELMRAHTLKDMHQLRMDWKTDHDVIYQIINPDRMCKAGKLNKKFPIKKKDRIAHTVKDNEKVRKSVIEDYLKKRDTIQEQMIIDGVQVPAIRRSIFLDSSARRPTVDFRKSLRSQSLVAKSSLRGQTGFWRQTFGKQIQTTDKTQQQNVEESPPASPMPDTYRRIRPDMSVGISSCPTRPKMASRLTRPFCDHELFKGTVTLDKVMQLGDCCDQTISDGGRVEMFKRDTPISFGEGQIRQCEQYFQTLKKEMTAKNRKALLEYGAALDCHAEEVRPIGVKPQAHCNTHDTAWMKFLQQQQPRTPLNIGIDDFIYAKNKEECFLKKRNARRRPCMMSRAKGFKLPTDDQETHLVKTLTMASSCHKDGGKCDPWEFTGQSSHRHSLDKASKLTDKFCFKELLTRNDKHWADSGIKDTECLCVKPKQSYCAKRLLPSEIEENKLAFMLRSKADECVQESHIDPWELTGQTKDQFIISVPTPNIIESTTHQKPTSLTPIPEQQTSMESYKRSDTFVRSNKNSKLSLDRQGNNACVMADSKTSDRQRNNISQKSVSKTPPELRQSSHSATSELITLGDVLPLEHIGGDDKNTACLVDRSSFEFGDSNTTLKKQHVSLEGEENLYSDIRSDVPSLVVKTAGKHKQNENYSKLKPIIEVNSKPRKRKLQRSSIDMKVPSIRTHHLTSKTKQLNEWVALDRQTVLKDNCDTSRASSVSLAYNNSCPWVVSARCKLEKEGCLNSKMNQERLHLESIRPSTNTASFPFHVPSYVNSNSTPSTSRGDRSNLQVQATATNVNTSCASNKHRNNNKQKHKAPSSALNNKLPKGCHYLTSTDINKSCISSVVPSLHAHQGADKQRQHTSKLKHNVTRYKQYPQLPCDLVQM